MFSIKPDNGWQQTEQRKVVSGQAFLANGKPPVTFELQKTPINPIETL
jgi:hypothetical protein